MNRKSLGILISTAVILLVGIGVAIVFLFSDKEDYSIEESTERFVEDHRLVKAVPSDAAIVFCVKNFGRACEYVNDSNAVFNQLLSGKFERLMKGSYSSLKRNPAILSVHYSKDLPPLLVIEATDAIADTTEDLTKFLAAADSSGLFARISDDLILVSSSETIINSSIRHLSEGHSVLESSGFSELAAGVRGEDVIFLSNTYAGSILDACFSKKYRKLAGFIKEQSSWTALSVKRHSESGTALHGQMQYDDEPSYYLNVLQNSGPSPVRVSEAVPSHTVFIATLPIGNISSYIKAYRNYLDSKNRLSDYKSNLSEQKAGPVGLDAETWAKSLDIKEMAIAETFIGDDLHQFLLIKPGKRQEPFTGSKDYPFTGFAKTLFGEPFTGENEDYFTYARGWIVAGSKSCIEEYSKPDFLHETLQEYLSGNGLESRIPQKDCGFFLYFSMGEDPAMIDAAFSKSIAQTCRRIIKGVSFVPLTLASVYENDRMCLEMNLDRTNVFKSKAPLAERDTSVAVPSGPFKVRNHLTNKMNTFRQNSFLSLCLQDENGKDVWGIPFKQPICGCVEEIDFFNNGKLQYLFAAGSKMYLIDRLGRFVNGFPVETGKTIAVGPAVYDFNGTHNYTVALLHKDNTIGMYNLRGEKAEGWKGITAKETIKSLPELLEANGRKYWTVRTSNQTIIFPFSGGDSVVKGEGEKMIRPDSKIVINEKGLVCAKCYDGKDRTFKLGQ